VLNDSLLLVGYGEHMDVGGSDEELVESSFCLSEGGRQLKVKVLCR
jgi:hypothetical protein